MLKKIPWKNIIIVFTAMLVVPVMAFAITMATEPSEEPEDHNSNIKITSDESTPDAASAATSVLTSGALGYYDAATSATGQDQNSQGGGTDAVSSATGNPGETGSIEDDDDQEDDDQFKEDDDDEEDEDEDDDDEEDDD